MTDSCLKQLGDSYIDLCTQIKPGDVLAFATCDLPANVVKIATQSCYVHVAIVLSVTTQAEHPDPILIAESHINMSLPSEGTGKKQLGVQFQRLSQRVVSCTGSVWWAALKKPLSKGGLDKMRSWLRDVEAKAVPYDFPQAVGAGVDILDSAGLSNQPDFNALFCSELVTRALQIADCIDDSVNPSEQTPADVMGFDCLQDPVLLSGD
ncbi:hypothetical protein [Leptothoe spongobia]|uniref:Uncharacterized protein n=1 Tax=Leptothoe spongobia TAU-MAC 1115 TaxID=1967444 RepID=A0A947DH82_9CYAN|nr:hypothetical protein [Leptothoe spongobia]MBT9317003.1 hypothetical protein [Leptothoe spongobia TAU-MAC 1115]